MFKLIKIQSKHNNLRTNEVVGYCPELPKVGERFVFYSEALDPEVKVLGGARIIGPTTPVLEVLPIDGAIEFKTQNSHYRLEALGGEELM